MKFVSRSAWGARPARGSTLLTSPRGVTIHWEGPHMGSFPHTHCAAKVRGIQNFHIDTREWADVAYTAIVCPHGYVFECRGIGRRSAANGTSAGNAGWYAVCALIGEGDPITPELLAGLDDAIAWLRDAGAGPAVNAHRDHKATQCPGDELYAWAHGHHDRAVATAQAVSEEEDPLPFDRSELEQFTHNGVLKALRDPQVRTELENIVWLDRTVSRGGQAVPVVQELADTKTQALALSGRVAALEAALTQAVKGEPLDLDAVRAAAAEGVADALSSVEATVTITTGDV